MTRKLIYTLCIVAAVLCTACNNDEIKDLQQQIDDLKEQLDKKGGDSGSQSDIVIDTPPTPDTPTDTTVVTPPKPETPTTGIVDGYEWVDLGLPSGTKWATCNVGATKPEEFGGYFAWGESEPKDTFSWNNYKWGNSMFTLTKYYTVSEYYESGDMKTTLDPKDDAATASWGNNWRMPTQDDQTELLEQCTWIWITQNQVNGFNVIGPNGNTIFLPAARSYWETSLKNSPQLNSGAVYWSSSLWSMFPHDARCIAFSTNDVRELSASGRSVGASVRPVLKEN